MFFVEVQYLIILPPLHFLQFINYTNKCKMFYMCCFTYVGSEIKRKFLDRVNISFYSFWLFSHFSKITLSFFAKRFGSGIYVNSKFLSQSSPIIESV